MQAAILFIDNGKTTGKPYTDMPSFKLRLRSELLYTYYRRLPPTGGSLEVIRVFFLSLIAFLILKCNIKNDPDRTSEKKKPAAGPLVPTV